MMVRAFVDVVNLSKEICRQRSDDRNDGERLKPDEPPEAGGHFPTQAGDPCHGPDG